MKRFVNTLLTRPWKSASLVMLTAWVALPGCAPGWQGDPDDDRVRVVTSFSVIEDLARGVAGERALVRGLAPVGAEVHEWELLPRNFVDLEGADIVFINGLGLEQWLEQLRATLPAGVPLVALAEEIEREAIPIQQGELRGGPDPHVWMDPRAAAEFAEIIRDRLIELDPEGEEDYRTNASAVLEELEALHDELAGTFARLPPERRLLITSEAAFLYFADTYGFQHAGIWGNNAEEEGTPRQVAGIVDLIRETRPAALFWESTITDRYVRGIAEDTRLPVAGPLYVDSLGRAGTGAESYVAMMRQNARVIMEALTEGSD